MTEKSRIVEDLGQAALLLPESVNRGLLANDRAKYFLSLLQTARDHADRPAAVTGDLRGERSAAQIPAPEFDAVIGGSERGGDGALHIPLAARIRAELLAAIGEMIAPVELAPTAGCAMAGDDAAALRARFDALAAELPPFGDDLVPHGTIARIASGRREAGDSLHILVMDLHKALNRLQAAIAQEVIGGAKAYRIDTADRPRIAAFMRGVNRTARLKLDHPGLGTTATRTGDRLILQNDIGTTDAHVLVVAVEGLAATVTYTDIHTRRLRFFQTLLKPFALCWSDTAARAAAGFETGGYSLTVGTFAAADEAELDRCLEHLGSRIVFLIDWNRARKRLAKFVEPADAIEILAWAAETETGHCPFLALGGEQLIYQAIDYAAKARLPYGEPLHEVLGRGRAVEYLKFVLRTASEGLLEHRSERLIRDEIKAELLAHFDTAQQSLIGLAGRHGVYIFEIAAGVRDCLLATPRNDGEAADGEARVRRNAERAARWESRADRLVEEARSMVRRAAGTERFQALLEEADDAADGLEEAAFLLTLMPARDPASTLVEPLQRLGALLLDGAQDYVKCLEGAAHVRRAGAREDLDDFLRAVDRLVAVEHAADDAARAVTAALVRNAADFRELHLGTEIARTLEEASDALSRSGLMMREYVIEEGMGP